MLSNRLGCGDVPSRESPSISSPRPRYIFLVNDARREGSRSITAAGTDNINNMHYVRNSSTLKDSDLVLMDYAPDYRYYRYENSSSRART